MQERVLVCITHHQGLECAVAQPTSAAGVAQYGVLGWALAPLWRVVGAFAVRVLAGTAHCAPLPPRHGACGPRLVASCTNGGGGGDSAAAGAAAARGGLVVLILFSFVQELSGNVVAGFVAAATGVAAVGSLGVAGLGGGQHGTAGGVHAGTAAPRQGREWAAGLAGWPRTGVCR